MHYLTTPPSDPVLVAGLVMGSLCFYYWSLWR